VGSNKKRRGFEVAGGLHKDLTGRQPRHVAIDAVGAECQARNFGLRAEIITAFLVAVHATGRKQFQVVGFFGMNIMTRRAVHFAHPETLAGGKQAVLVAMNVQGGCTVCAVDGERKFIQLVAHYKGKRRHEVVADPGMAKGTIVQSLLPA